ncbi:MAG: hypothetical protein Q4E88_02655 [Coriobacteriia bacterium]|nr:hypothetical protein [Coriobacteriia bacterium]
MEMIVSALSCEAIYPNTFICGVGAKKLPCLDGVDHLINIGICAGREVGQIFLANKIIGEKTYYPDVFGNIPSRNLITVSSPVSEVDGDMLYDMEASNIYKYAQKYLGPHQMHFIKIVSDAGENKLDKSYVHDLILSHKDKIDEYLSSLAVNESFEFDLNLNKLHCTETMKARLYQQCKYAKIADIDISRFFAIEARDKKESMQLLDKIDKYLIGETK